ncbi:MAG: NAD-dependent epimerase/dehydratase family protein, partial [Leucothrix sp.]
LAKQAGAKWFIYASSREVYGHVKSTPVRECDGLNPVNVYGEAKLKSETAIARLADADFNPAIVRFSNVFGAVDDHATRVVPAFIKAAHSGKDLHIEGGINAFDFTFIDEVVRALGLLINQLQQGRQFQPMHFTTGKETSLSALANEAIELFNSQSRLVDKTPRDFDVSRFSGDATLAEQQLGWRHNDKSLGYFLQQYAMRLGMLENKYWQEDDFRCSQFKQPNESCGLTFG